MDQNLPSSSQTASSTGALAGYPRAALVAFILLLTFAAYAPTLRYDFVHDDRAQIMENPAITSWSYLPQYFSKQVWAGYAPGIAGNYYRPVFLIWLRLNHMVFGLQPWGWHLTTVLLHLLATLLVFILGERLLHDSTTAAAAALLFGLHPIHVEGVTWVSGLTEPLMVVFFIPAFLCHLNSREKRGDQTRWKLLALFCFLMSLFEKETAIILPALIMTYEWIYAGRDPENISLASLLRRSWDAARPSLPFFALIVPYLIARVIALEGFSHPLTNYPLTTIFATVPFLFTFWLRHLLWPTGLSIYYDYGAVEHLTFVNFFLPALVLAVVCAIALFAGKKSRAVAFFICWTVLPLLPPLDIRTFARNEFAHDRYLYLPSVGFVILVALALRYFSAGRTYRRVPVTQAVAAILLTPLMTFGVAKEGSYMTDSWTFYQHCAQYAPHNGLAMTNYAAALGERKRYAEALPILSRVVEENPNFWFGIYNFALTNYQVGQLEKAEMYFHRAIFLEPNEAEEHLYLGLIELKTGRLQEAEQSVRRAVQLAPQGFGNHFALGVILRLQGDLEGARRELQMEIKYHPENQAAGNLLSEIQGPAKYFRN